MNNSIEKEYNEVIKRYVFEFKRRYFDNVEEDTYWIGDETFGGVLYINDYYFSFNNIKYAIDNSVDEKSLFEWYDHITSYGIENDNQVPPTLKEWWENKDNKTKKLEWNLSVHNKKLFDFIINDFELTTDMPNEDGYYLVISVSEDGIYQKPIEWYNGNWVITDNSSSEFILNSIARTKRPILLFLP